MRHIATISTSAVVVMTVQVLLAQAHMKPTAPGTPGEPTWQGFIGLRDGRTFITDGGFTMKMTSLERLRKTVGAWPVRTD
jgi:hypothetical protein